MFIKQGDFLNLQGRYVAIDIEATGNDNNSGIIVEIGAVEIIDGSIGEIFHTYVNPLNKVSKFAFDVHGLSNDFLSDKPRFHEVIESFFKFVGNSTIVGHDVVQDIKFLNKELNAIGLNSLSRAKAWCTQRISKHLFKFDEKFSLDALCDKLNIDRSERIKHGAVIDAILCAKCLIEMSKIKFPEKTDIMKNFKKIKPIISYNEIILDPEITTFSKFGKTVIIPNYPNTHKCVIKEYESQVSFIICKKQGKPIPNNPYGFPAALKLNSKKFIAVWFTLNYEKHLKTVVYDDPPSEYGVII